jgi:hypothetical protein
MDLPLFCLGLAMIGIGILISLVQVRTLKDRVKDAGGFTTRLLISGIGFIIIGSIIVVKSFS